MARVFISHSSRDNEAAAEIKRWLGERGFETPFLDFDKHAGIPPGADWEKALYREVERSEAVVIIQTPNWHDSKWCFVEFAQARQLGKAIFPIIDGPVGESRIAQDVQALDLRSNRAEGLERLGGELTRIALDAQGGFTWDASRPPYPGLLAFEEADAAVYFGRDDESRRLIERLNARRAQGGIRLIALLGASGSGKSSLLRAGVIPRLKRDRRNWIVLPPMRPQARPIDELTRCLAVAAGEGYDWRKLQVDLLSRDPVPAFADLASTLQIRASANEAQILLPIDQAEELFGAADPDQAERFLTVLSSAITADLPIIAVMAIQSDHLGGLQSAAALTARFEEFSLGPLPLARIPQIIQGPARVAGLHVDDELVQQAARDAETEDALPLLAFALRELHDRAGQDNRLSLAEYQAMGDPQAGLTPLENAVRKAADAVVTAVGDPADMVALREAFVPAMVRVNDEGEYVRRPVRWDELPGRAHWLLEALIKARLLTAGGDGEAQMVEVAHEALLRKWPLLRSWLDEAREFLIGKQQLDRDLRDWDKAAARDKPTALLTGLKLNRARLWLNERPQQLSAPERSFIQASIAYAEAAESGRRRLRRTITGAALAAALVLAVVALLAWRRGDQLVEAASTRAHESIGYVWTDLAAKQAEEVRLRKLAAGLKQQPEALLPNVLQVKQPDGFDCKTSLPLGFRYLHCMVRNVINVPKLESIASQSVFRPGGPHGKDLALGDENRFGRYDPRFLDWLDQYIIPEGMTDPRANAQAREVYAAYIGPTARALYRTHEIVFADAARFAAFEQDYARLKKRFSPNHRGLGGFATDPKPIAGIRAEYERRLTLPVAQRTKDRLGQSGNGAFFEEQFHWLSDYILRKYSNEDTDWYLASASSGFWVRRSIDGTEARIFELVKKVLNTFEPDVLAGN
jgi:hypothetical protein